MAKRSFLRPISAVIAALGAATPWASKAAVETTTPSVPQATRHAAVEPASGPVALNEVRDVVVRENGDLFKFVLKRAEDGRFLAYHQSHSSHDSHSSHSSHRSHYSSS